MLQKYEKSNVCVKLQNFGDMKLKITLIAVATVAMASCVSLSEMESLQAKYDQTSKQYALVKQELSELKEENTALTRQNQNMQADMGDIMLKKQQADALGDSLRTRLEQLQQHYDTTMENYTQEVAGKNRDLRRAQNLLTARTKELNQKADELSVSATTLWQGRKSWNAKKRPRKLASMPKKRSWRRCARPLRRHWWALLIRG